MAKRARTTAAASSAAATPAAPRRRGRRAAAAAAAAPAAAVSGSLRPCSVASLPTLSLVAVRQVVLHVNPTDLMELRQVSKSVRSTVDQAVDSVGFAARHLRRWILESTGEQSWDAILVTLLNHGAAWDYQDRNLFELITEYAERTEDDDNAAFLLDKAKRIPSKSYARRWAVAACARGLEETVKKLIQLGVDLNVYEYDEIATRTSHSYTYDSTYNYTSDKNSALHLAARNGHTSTVAVMLRGGARPYIRNKSKNQPIHAAAANGHLAIVSLLLDAGAEPGPVANERYTPLHYAVKMDFIDVVRRLIQAGADVNPKTDYLNAPIHFAARMGLVNMVTLLLENGAGLEDPGQDKSQPILLAATNGHLSTVQLLLERGAQVACQNVLGSSPVHSAVEGAHLAVLQLLLDAAGSSSSTDVADCTGKRPIHLAAERGNLQAASLLITRGASLAEHKGDCHSPLYLAALEGHTSVVRLMLEHGAELASNDPRNRLILVMIEKARNAPTSEHTSPTSTTPPSNPAPAEPTLDILLTYASLDGRFADTGHRRRHLGAPGYSSGGGRTRRHHAAAAGHSFYMRWRK
ncbi:hypothetical protein HK405_005358 [Cladochytrium tenue]|nr:hypothetical protein HK405_005358 [Cladochytrium tenue]